jgi:hypothetical protein
MPKEFLIDRSETHCIWGRADEDGFTTRTQYPGTEALLDLNHATRTDPRKDFKMKNGALARHVASLPVELYEMLYRKLGRDPTAKECLEMARDRDYNKLLTVDKV